MAVVVGSPVCTYDGAGFLQWRGTPDIPIGGTGPTPPDPDPLAIYHPLSVVIDPAAVTSLSKINSLNSQGLDLPTDANLVVWPYSNPDGARVNVWVESFGGNDIGFMPEKVRADGTTWDYLFDTAPGFRRDNAGHYWVMFNMTRGLAGGGPKTRLSPAPSSFTMAPQPRPTGNGDVGWFDTDGQEKIGCQLKVIECSTANPYFGNFEFTGRSYGGVAYNGVAFRRGIYTCERLYMNACWRGDQNAPNREAGAIACKGGPCRKMRNIECEGRDSTGARVGATCIMFNSMAGCHVSDVYVHHTKAGHGITAWSCDSTVALPWDYTRVRSEFPGSGSGIANGAGYNFELQTGIVNIYGDGTDKSTIICNYLGSTDTTQGTTNNELHISGGSNEARATINVYNVKIDKGSRPRNKAGTSKTAADGTFTMDVQLFGYTSGHGQYGLNVHVFDAAGVEQPVFIHGTWTP